MIPIIIVSHGNLAQEFIHVLTHVMGPQEKITAIGITPQDDMTQKHKDLTTLVEEYLTDDKGVIILTDMFGGTPSNMSLSLQDHPHVEIIAGLNLPLLLKLATIRNTLPIEEAALEAQAAGRKYIHVASEILKKAV